MMLILIVYVCTVRRWYLKCVYTTLSLCHVYSEMLDIKLALFLGWLHYQPSHHQVTHSLMKKVNRIEPSTRKPVHCIRKHTSTWYPFNSDCIWALRTPLYHHVHSTTTGWDRLAVCHDCRNAFTTSSLSTTAEDPRRWPLWAWHTLIIKNMCSISTTWK